jgi:hypothetical protein
MSWPSFAYMSNCDKQKIHRIADCHLSRIVFPAPDRVFLEVSEVHGQGLDELHNGLVQLRIASDFAEMI